MFSKDEKKYGTLRLAITWCLGLGSAFILVATFYSALIARQFVSLNADIYDKTIFTNTPGTTEIAGMEGYGVTTYGENGLVVNKLLKHDVKRVLFSGDSFVKAIQVSDPDKFTEIVEKKWNSAHSDDEIQTVNIGQPSLDTRDYIQFGSNVDRIFMPDLVFLMVGESDFTSIARRKELESKIIAGEYDSLVRPESASFIRSTINRLGLHSLAGQLKKQTFAFLEAGKPNSTNSDAENLLNDDYLRQSIERQLGALESIWGDRLVILYRHPISDYGASVEQGLNTTLYKALVQGDIQFIDTYSALSAAMKDGRPPHGFMNFNLGQGHLNRTGHELVAGLVVSYLEDVQ